MSSFNCLCTISISKLPHRSWISLHIFTFALAQTAIAWTVVTHNEDIGQWTVELQRKKKRTRKQVNKKRKDKTKLGPGISTTQQGHWKRNSWACACDRGADEKGDIWSIQNHGQRSQMRKRAGVE
jgi:hypothetical protein